MSTQQNVQTVQEMYAAFGRGDIATLLDGVADDVVWIEQGPASVPTAGCYEGRAGVAAFFQKVGDLLEFERFEPGEFIADGENVVALGFLRAKVKATGRMTESHWAMVFTFRSGKLIKFREYSDTASAAAAYESGA